MLSTREWSNFVSERFDGESSKEKLRYQHIFLDDFLKLRYQHM